MFSAHPDEMASQLTYLNKKFKGMLHIAIFIDGYDLYSGVCDQIIAHKASSPASGVCSGVFIRQNTN